MPCLEEIEKDAVKRSHVMGSLSCSLPSGALSKTLHTNWDENMDPLSSSCFASISLEKFSAVDTSSYDDELTSLAWLQDANLLKNIAPAEKCPSPMPKRDSATVSNSVSVSLPYDPLRHVKHKPPYSFSCLIFMAIENSLCKRLPVKGIYDWIAKNYPYFQTAPDGWKNSVRHNLSLNKCFKKVERDHHQGLGKGSSWCIDSKHRPNLLQALRRTPYHPFQQLQMVSNGNGTSQNDGDVKPLEEDMSLQMNKGKLPSRELFPFLNKQLCQINSSVGASSDADSDDLTKRKSTKWASHASNRSLVKQKLSSCSNIGDLVCTSYPSADHTYSIPEDVLEGVRGSSDKSSSVDEGLDCGSESEEDNLAEDQIESDSISDVNLADDTQSALDVTVEDNQSGCAGCADEVIVAVQKTEDTSSMVEGKENTQADDRDDQEKRNFFAAMALIEMSSSVPQNVPPKKVSKRLRMVPAKLKEASEAHRKLSDTCVKGSERCRKALDVSINVSAKEDKVSGKRKRATAVDDDDGNDVTADKKHPSNTRAKRIRKRLLPINSSLWGVRRKLSNLDSSLESPKKPATVKKQAIVKKSSVKERLAVTRPRRK